MRTLTFLLSLSLSFPVFPCPLHKSVQAGEPAPCAGHFLNSQANEFVKKDLRDNELRKKQIELKDLQIKDLTTDRDDWKVQAEKQAQINHGKDSDLKKGVVAGVIMTLAVMFVVRQVGK